MSSEPCCFIRQATFPAELGTVAGAGWPPPAGRVHQLCLPTENRAHSFYHQDNFTSLMLKNSFCGVEFRAGTHTQTKQFPQEIQKEVLCIVMYTVLKKYNKRDVQRFLLYYRRVKTYSASCEKQMKNKIQCPSHTYRA